MGMAGRETIRRFHREMEANSFRNPGICRRLALTKLLTPIIGLESNYRRLVLNSGQTLSALLRSDTNNARGQGSAKHRVQTES